MEVAIIGGGGTIGSTTAYTLAVERPAVDITIVDIDEDMGSGHAIDVRHGRALNQLPQFHTDTDANLGSVSAAPSEGASLATADVAVVTASIPRPAESAKRGGRAEFLDRNLELATTVAETLDDRDPLPVVVVTNPVDRITYKIWQETGWDRHWFLGYSLSETARTADKLSEILEVPANEIYCPVGGEHGENVVPFFSHLTVDGESVAISADDEQVVRDYIRDVPYDVIEQRGAEHSSRWVTGQGVARLVGAILDDGLQGAPVAVSVGLSGEYGLEDVCLSVPVEIGREGVGRILEWEFSEEERDRLQAASDAIRADF